MTHPVHDDDHDEPLDPVLERVQARLRRLMLIAGLTLGVGIFAVFAAILYRIAIMDASDATPVFVAGDAVPTITRSAVGVPLDAELTASAASDDELILTYAHGDGESLVIIDLETLSVTRRLDITAK